MKPAEKMSGQTPLLQQSGGGRRPASQPTGEIQSQIRGYNRADRGGFADPGKNKIEVIECGTGVIPRSLREVGYWGSTERKTGLAQPKIGRFFCKFKVIKGVGFKLQNSWDWALTSEEALRTEPPQSTGDNGLNHLRNGQPLNPVFRSVDPQYPYSASQSLTTGDLFSSPAILRGARSERCSIDWLASPIPQYQN